MLSPLESVAGTLTTGRLLPTKIPKSPTQTALIGRPRTWLPRAFVGPTRGRQIVEVPVESRCRLLMLPAPVLLPCMKAYVGVYQRVYIEKYSVQSRFHSQPKS